MLKRLIYFLFLWTVLCCGRGKENPVHTNNDESPAYGDTIIVGSIGDASNFCWVKRFNFIQN